MAVTPIFELDVPAPHDVFFRDGEKALSVSPVIDGAAPRINYHLATWATLEGGTYFLRVMAENVSSWATCLTKLNFNIFFYTKRDAGPHEAVVYLPRGRQRIDLILSNLGVAPGPCYIAFSLWRQGKLVYTSSGNGWVFNDGPIEDNEIPEPPDVRSFFMAPFTILPNWERGIIERVKYSTEILASESNMEQRRSLRLQPRRSFEVSFARSRALRARLDSFLAGVGKNLMLVPIWHEQYMLTNVLGASLAFPSGTLQFREFVSGMYCLVMHKNPNVYEKIQIASVNLETDTITFFNAPAATWGVGARIIPLRVGRIVESSTIDNKTDAVGLTQIRFEIDDSEQLWFEPSWNGLRLFTFTPDRATDISTTYDRPTAFVIDGEYGVLDVHDAEQRGSVVTRGALHFRGPRALMKYRQFLDMARGRAVSFWIPTFTTDFYLLSDLVGLYIDVKSVGFTDLFKTIQVYRAALAIALRDGRTIYRFITDVEELDDETERITFDEVLPIVGAGDVYRISYLMPVRFDQDSFELLHLVSGSAHVQAAFVVRTAETMPLPVVEQNVLTSLVYPIEVIESLNAAGTFVSGRFGDTIDDRIDVNATLPSALLETVIAFKTITADPESIDVNATLPSALLETVIAFKTITADPESIDVGATLLGGSIQSAINFVEHVDPADDEELDVNATLTGASLVNI